ncbi:MAG: alpha/beta hydrolase-fold protein [Myxococcota bacterium]|nr:alpha/beta hydrolase-fold protein [Myxococcota bacterium]
MHVEYHKWYSPSLGHDMELKVYGHAGKPVIVFPSSGGSYHEYEDFGMVEVCRPFIDDGRITLFTPGSADTQSWMNEHAHPAQRAARHNDYDRYIVRELAPLAREMRGHHQKCLGTGCSLGAYHSANFFFRHPDVFDACIALSGIYRLDEFIGDYMDENVYFNTPLAYLPGLDDPWFLEQYRQSKIVICVGQGAWEEPMLSHTRELGAILERKGVPAWIDIWGHDVNHDWPWWRRQMPFFLGHVLP